MILSLSFADVRIMGASTPTSQADPLLSVYQVGEVTVIGFSGRDVPDEVCIAAYRTQIDDLLEKNQVQTLAFDLTGVRLMPSGLLGVLASLKKKVDKIELYNCSPEIREVLEITNLGSLFEVKEVAV